MNLVTGPKGPTRNKIKETLKIPRQYFHTGRKMLFLIRNLMLQGIYNKGNKNMEI